MGHVARACRNLVGGEGARRGSSTAVLSLLSITRNAHCLLSGHSGPYRTSEELGSPCGLADPLRSIFLLVPLQQWLCTFSASITKLLLRPVLSRRQFARQRSRTAIFRRLSQWASSAVAPPSEEGTTVANSIPAMPTSAHCAIQVSVALPSFFKVGISSNGLRLYGPKLTETS